MLKIIDSQKTILNNLIGAEIQFAIIPELTINNNCHIPFGQYYPNQYGHFYSSHSVYLRCKISNTLKWIKICPGLDENIEPWAPFNILEYKELDLHEIIGNKDELLKEVNTFQKKSSQNHYFDTYDSNIGFSRINCWPYQDPILEIELFYFSEYCLIVLTHCNNFKWSIYCEYDFTFWLNFNTKLVEDLNKSSLHTAYIKITSNQKLK